MTIGLWRALLLAAATAAPAFAQFQIYLVNGNLELPVARVYDFGRVDPGSSLAVPFRMRNTSNAPALVDFLSVNGSGFSIASGPAIPTMVAPSKAVDVTVLFQSAGTGTYSASLDTVGIAVILTATVPLELTCEVSNGQATKVLDSAPTDFGTVDRDLSVTRRFTLLNQTAATLIVPGIATSGPGFTLDGPSPYGSLLHPTESATFDVRFSPGTNGAHTGSLIIGDRSFNLIGTGVEPPLPLPHISVSVPQPLSAQQGAVTVSFDAGARTSGTGTVTIRLQPATAGANDPAAAFATGGQTATFTVSQGDAQARFGAQLTAPFQTGTTAGTLTLEAELGGQIDRQTVVIAPAAVALTDAKGLRSTNSVEVDLTGFDNTRSAGPLTFSFFDAAGKALGAPIQADSTAAFAGYFTGSAGGTFILRAVFPVTGDPNLVKSFEAVVANSAGTGKTTRIDF